MGVGSIEQYFSDRFSHWGITLPTQDVARRAPGHIFERGWHIGYVWGTEAGEEYLEVLAQHRMTGDDHFRVFVSGRLEQLPAPGESYMYGPDATEEEKEAARQRFVERNERIYAELRERGLLPPAGENLPAHEINEYLRAGGEVPEPEA